MEFLGLSEQKDEQKNLNSNEKTNEEKNISEEKPKKPQIIFGKNPISSGITRWYVDRKEKNLNSKDEPNEEKNIFKEKTKKPQIIFGKNPMPDEEVENEYVPLNHISDRRKKDEENFTNLKAKWKPSLDFQQQRSQSFFEKTTNVDNRKTVSISPRNYFTINVEGSTSREKAIDIANLVTSEFEKEKYLNVIGSVR